MNELGNWISQGTQKPFYVRKEFDVKKEIVKAAAYVCGLGQFIFHLNGQKVADHELDPGWTNYDKKIQYVKYYRFGAYGKKCAWSRSGERMVYKRG